MAAASAELMTFAEFEKLPDGPFRYELHRGELIRRAPPQKRHFFVQRRLRRILEAAAGDAGLVDKELAYRATPEHEYRVADVAFVAKERWEQTSTDGILEGAPDIVIEVLSQSNTVSEMLDKEQLCLENGALEFWVVDPARGRVKVSTPVGQKFYTAGRQIPLLFGGTVDVDDIFKD